jgi:uncharacterized protein
MVKKFKWVYLFLLLFLFQLPVQGEGKLIFDHADLLLEDKYSELSSLAEEISQESEIDIIVIIEENLKGNGIDIEKYTQDAYDQYKFGYEKEYGNTAILTIDLKGREVYLAGFGDYQKYLTNSRLDEIREDITPFLSENKFDLVIEQFIKEVDRHIGMPISPNNIFLKTWFQLIIALIIAATIVGIMLFNMGGKVTVSHQTYVDNSRIKAKRDVFTHKTVTRTKIPKNDNNSGGGGVTSGGHSHTGSRGSF